ncbi:probable small intestine urate exporter [Stegodyphus dumicola]|uniref:probable small intestine urate exporter n=1 Tax=Stegodyphus dumicola TaxID=202533 RepID=UPI0015AB6A68|nr:probable small intestine urate exporter [Stegodyphus dumicola]
MMMCALVPSQQLVRYAAFTTTGMHTGAFITYGLAGIICSTGFLGWEYVFYISGASGVVWCIFWFYLQWDHNFRSAFKIPIFIQEDVKKHRKLPIASILKSYPVWAYIVVGVASYWSYSFNILMLPMYFRTAFEIETEWNGLASSYPNLLQAFTFLLSSLMSDRLLEKKVVRKISVRKFCVATGLSLAATFMVLLTFILCSRALSTLVMVFALGSLGPTLTALVNIPVDLSPRYSGILSGIMNTLGALTGSLLPFMVGYFSKSSDGMELWGKVFYATCFISFIAVIIFLAYGSAQIQPWDNLIDANPSNVPNESESLEALPPANWSNESLLSSLPEQPLKKEERSTSKIPENIFKADFGNIKKY